MLERSRHRGGLGGIAVDIKCRRIVAVNLERRDVAELGVDRAVEVGVDLALFGVGAGYLGPVAIGRRRRPADKMIVLVGGDDKQRVVFGDAVYFQAVEEFPERGVVGGELLDISVLAGTEGAALTGEVIVVRVGNVAVNHRHPCLEHRREIT